MLLRKEDAVGSPFRAFSERCGHRAVQILLGLQQKVHQQ